MKLIAITLLVIGSLIASQVRAEDAAAQPLTRRDCVKVELVWDENANVCSGDQATSWPQPLSRLDCKHAGMAWDETGNVCGTPSQASEARAGQGAESDLAEVISQPLTRQGCEEANLIWDYSANMCGTASHVAMTTPENLDTQRDLTETLGQGLTRDDCDKAGLARNGPTNACGEKEEPIAKELPQSSVLIKIDKADQKMTVFLEGVQQYEWPVSTGLRGYTTPSGTYTARSMNKIWYSREWDNAPMPHAVFFTRDGHAIHGTNETKRLGKPASHGCVRLSPKNAATLYAMVDKIGLMNTQVVLAGATPGGEGKVATKSKRGVATSKRGSKSLASRPKYKNYYAEAIPQPPSRRGGIFRRLFGR